MKSRMSRLLIVLLCCAVFVFVPWRFGSLLSHLNLSAWGIINAQSLPLWGIWWLGLGGLEVCCCILCIGCLILLFTCWVVCAAIDWVGEGQK